MRIKSLMTPRVLRAVRRLLIHSNRSLTYSVYGTELGLVPRGRAHTRTRC